MKRNNAIKMAALKLATLNWMQRTWIMSRLPSQKRKAIKPFMQQLKRFNRNERKLALQKFQQNKSSDKTQGPGQILQNRASQTYPYLNKIANGEVIVKPAVMAMCLDEINS